MINFDLNKTIILIEKNISYKYFIINQKSIKIFKTTKNRSKILKINIQILSTIFIVY